MRVLSVIISTAILFALISCGGSDNGNGPEGDTTPPTVTATDPASNSVDVPITAAISATFSEDMKASTVSAVTFLMNRDIAGTVTYDNRTATFTPDENLEYNQTYIATITTDVRDVAGNKLAANYMWSFITAAANVPPIVTAIYPDSGDTMAPIDGVITATFSKAINPVTLTESSFTVSPSVTGTIGYTDGTATFTPDVDLDFNTTYTVTLTTDIEDTLNIALTQDFVWSFKTSPIRIVHGTEYFPFSPGDIWYYTNASMETIIRTVGGDTTINDRTCTRILHNGATYEAWSIDSVAFYVHLLDEVLRFEPPLQIPLDLIIEYPYAYSSEVFANGSSVGTAEGTIKFKGYVSYTVPAGIFDNVVKLDYLPDGYSEYYARGIGLLDNDDFVLDSAVVGGKSYKF